MSLRENEGGDLEILKMKEFSRSCAAEGSLKVSSERNRRKQLSKQVAWLQFSLKKGEKPLSLYYIDI